MTYRSKVFLSWFFHAAGKMHSVVRSLEKSARRIVNTLTRSSFAYYGVRTVWRCGVCTVSPSHNGTLYCYFNALSIRRSLNIMFPYIYIRSITRHKHSLVRMDVYVLKKTIHGCTWQPGTSRP